MSTIRRSKHTHVRDVRDQAAIDDCLLEKNIHLDFLYRNTGERVEDGYKRCKLIRNPNEVRTEVTNRRIASLEVFLQN